MQTRTGRSVANYIAPPSDFQATRFYELLRVTYGKNWLPRKAACGGYNCAGLVWASRRTALPDPADWARILLDDGYRTLAHEEIPRIGDVALYVKPETREVIHVARVCGSKSLEDPGGRPLGGTRPIPWGLSKWDAKSGEDCHAVRDVYLNGGEEFEVEYWTDRP